MAVTHPVKENLYRLPWSMNDNPIGWVEVTDICNIQCKGCYRLVMGEGHKPLQQLKDEIQFLKKWRNCDNITLAGGEPILHPDILELISFISGLNMKSMILSNGFAITDKLLRDLKKAGLTGLSFHIDSTQTRPEFKKQKLESEMQLNDLRLSLGKMMRKVGLYAHFGITVTKRSYTEVPQFIQWAMDNMKLINGISLIIYRGLPITDGIEYYNNGKKEDVSLESLGYTIDSSELDEVGITAQDVYAKIKESIPDYDATAYLGGTINHDTFKWLVGNIIVNSKGKTFGAYGKKTVEWVQTMYHLFNGTYLVYPKKRIGKKMFLMSFLDRSVRKAFVKFMKYAIINPLRFFYPINAFGIGIVQAPDILPDGRIEMCDDCPDMCVYEGKLVNSCRLDECREYGDLLHVHIDDKEGKEVIRKSRVPITMHEN
jgi:hypothetical protein